MFQSWENLLFLHWEVEPEVLLARIPKRLKLDLHDGRAYLGIVPFFMNNVRPRFFPTVPGLSNFLELNVRTYVYDQDGRPGVYFLSLDCNQALAVAIAKSRFHLPYYNAQMSAVETDGIIDFSCRREGHLQKGRYLWETPQGGEIAKPGTLEFFLLERYLLFSQRRNGELFCGRVHHEPYQFSEAKVTKVGIEPLDWEQIPFKGAPVSALASRGVDVSIHALKSIKMTKSE